MNEGKNIVDAEVSMQTARDTYAHGSAAPLIYHPSVWPTAVFFCFFLTRRCSGRKHLKQLVKFYFSKIK